LERPARGRFPGWPARIKHDRRLVERSAHVRRIPETMRQRRKVSREELHAWLEREFRATAAELCGRCRVPLPVLREAMARPNWRLPAQEECPALCHTVLEEIAARAGERFDLAT
jgi:hypothetical protein